MAEENVTRAGAYTQLQGIGEAITRSGAYVQLQLSHVRVTRLGAYIQLEDFPVGIKPGVEVGSRSLLSVLRR